MKYIITILCDDDGEFYTECVNRMFDSHKAACDAAYKCAEQEAAGLNELPVDENESKDEFFVEKCGDDEVSVYECYDDGINKLITRYNVFPVIESDTQTVVEHIMMKYPEKAENIGEKLLNNALCYFEYFFDIDSDDETYACGSLEKLNGIIGKDYRDSELLIDIANSFDKDFEPEYCDTEDSWKWSIIEVIGKETFEKAFGEGDE